MMERETFYYRGEEDTEFKEYLFKGLITPAYEKAFEMIEAAKSNPIRDKDVHITGDKIEKTIRQKDGKRRVCTLETSDRTRSMSMIVINTVFEGERLTPEAAKNVHEEIGRSLMIGKDTKKGLLKTYSLSKALARGALWEIMTKTSFNMDLERQSATMSTEYDHAIDGVVIGANNNAPTEEDIRYRTVFGFDDIDTIMSTLRRLEVIGDGTYRQFGSRLRPPTKRELELS